MAEGRGWYTQDYLPHYDAKLAPQFLTRRLADALPASVLEEWKEELRGLADSKRRAELSRRIEAHCDAGHGSCVLAKPLAANIVQQKLIAEHFSLFLLHSWVIMPNHVHAVLTPLERVDLDELMRLIKGSTSREINKLVGRRGRLWQPDYFDRMIRDDEHFRGASKYIEWNPVKAKLCVDPRHWHWSSANVEAQRRLADRESQACDHNELRRLNPAG